MNKQPVAIAAGLILIILGGVAAVFNLPRETSSQDERISVVASFYPLAEFARQVGGEHVTVTTLAPAGVEPHDFEPSPSDVGRAYEADLFVYNGGGIDVWASALAPSIAARGVKTLEIRTAVGTLLASQESPEEGEEPEAFDEHFWLDPVLAIKEVVAIKEAMSDIDPAHAEEYEANAYAYIAKLNTLDRDYRDGLAYCKLRTVVTSHTAFAYMAHAYEFTQLPIAGISPDEEPSAGDLAALTKIARETGVKHVFFESLASPELSETLAREIGAQTLELNPLEGLTDEQADNGEDYLSVMRHNLVNLRVAMNCL